jgi:hypothetical protein
VLFIAYCNISLALFFCLSRNILLLFFRIKSSSICATEWWKTSSWLLYLVNIMLHCHNSCTSLKHMHYHLVSGFNIGPKLYNLEDKDSTLFLKKSKCTAEKESQIYCYSSSSVLGFDRKSSTEVFQQVGIVVLPCQHYLWKFHAVITILIEELLNKVGLMLKSDTK